MKFRISLCRVFESLNSQFFSISLRFSIYNRFLASSTNSNQNQVILDVYRFLLHLCFVYSFLFTRALRLFCFCCFTLLYQSIRNIHTAKIMWERAYTANQYFECYWVDFFNMFLHYGLLRLVHYHMWFFITFILFVVLCNISKSNHLSIWWTLTHWYVFSWDDNNGGTFLKFVYIFLNLQSNLLYSSQCNANNSRSTQRWITPTYN